MNCEIQVRRSEKKTNAQKCKEYRERKKLKGVRVPKNSAQREAKPPKTDGERSKQYRERQEIKKQIELQQKHTDRFQSKLTMTRAEYMKEYRRKVKLKNLIIQLNGLPAEYHSDAIKKITCDVQQGTQNDREYKKSHSQSVFQAAKPTYKRRNQTELIDAPPRSTDGSQTSNGPWLGLNKEEVKEVRPEKYPEVAVKEGFPKSEDVSFSRSRTLCDGACPRLVKTKEKVKEVLPETYLEVIVKEEVPESEDVSLSGSTAFCDGACTRLVPIEMAKEVFSEIYVEVTVKEEVPESEDGS